MRISIIFLLLVASSPLTAQVLSTESSSSNLMLFLLGALIFVLCAALLLRLNRFKHNLEHEQQQRLVESLLDTTKEGVWIADHHLCLQQVNHAFSTLTGYTAEDVLGREFTANWRKPASQHIDKLIHEGLEKEDFWSGEFSTNKANGEEQSLELTITKLTSNYSEHIRYIGIFSDVSLRKANEKELVRLATRDTLTGLPNRTLCIEYLEKAIAGVSSDYPSFVLMFIDLDKFHKVNDTLGHIQGDTLLIKAADRINNELEKGMMLARLGGDEFAVIIPAYLLTDNPFNKGRNTASRLLRCFDSPIQLDDINIAMTASIGLATYPDDGTSTESLMRAADTALNHAKHQGRNNFQFFSKSTQSHDSSELELEGEMWQALQDKEFDVYYQPKVDVGNNLITGFEALLRWHNPRRGDVPPGEFIPLAETNGLIIQLGKFVIEKVCSDMRHWYRRNLMRGHIAINISAIHFQRSDLVTDILAITRNYQVSPESLEFEVTESAMMKNPEFAMQQMERLRQHGFSIALDDFGTGHSSLGYLKRFPIDRLKIDRSFIQDIVHSEQDRNISATMVRLAKYMNIKVVAEGVEDEQTAFLLHVMGCDELQGFLFSKAIPFDEVPALIEREGEKFLGARAV